MFRHVWVIHVAQRHRQYTAIGAEHVRVLSFTHSDDRAALDAQLKLTNCICLPLSHKSDLFPFAYHRRRQSFRPQKRKIIPFLEQWLARNLQCEFRQLPFGRSGAFHLLRLRLASMKHVIVVDAFHCIKNVARNWFLVLKIITLELINWIETKHFQLGLPSSAYTKYPFGV